MATLGGVALALVFGGRPAAAGAVALLWVRAAWDALHIGEANVLLLPLPKNYAAGAMAVKAAAGLLFALFAFPR